MSRCAKCAPVEHGEMSNHALPATVIRALRADLRAALARAEELARYLADCEHELTNATARAETLETGFESLRQSLTVMQPEYERCKAERDRLITFRRQVYSAVTADPANLPFKMFVGQLVSLCIAAGEKP